MRRWQGGSWRTIAAVFAFAVTQLLPPAASAQHRAAARRELEEAQRQWDAGNYQLALEGFERTQRMTLAIPDIANRAVLLDWNIGRAQEQLGGRSVPTAVVGLADARAIAAGGGHTCALLPSGGVSCWGYGGLVGDGTMEQRTTPTPVMALSDAIDISAGNGHTCAPRAAGSVVCWGSNGSGQLGDGTTANSPSPITVSEVIDGIDVSAGYAHSCLRHSTGTASCWGLNDFGQLGDGTTTDSTVPVVVSGL